MAADNQSPGILDTLSGWLTQGTSKGASTDSETSFFTQALKSASALGQTYLTSSADVKKAQVQAQAQQVGLQPADVGWAQVLANVPQQTWVLMGGVLVGGVVLLALMRRK